MVGEKVRKTLREEKGFTLIELIGVIFVIVSILLMASQSYKIFVEKSFVKKMAMDGLMVLEAADQYFLENPDKESTEFQTLHNLGYIKNTGTLSYGHINSNLEYTKFIADDGKFAIEYNLNSTNGNQYKYKMTKKDFQNILSEGEYTRGSSQRIGLQVYGGARGIEWDITAVRIEVPLEGMMASEESP